MGYVVIFVSSVLLIQSKFSLKKFFFKMAILGCLFTLFSNLGNFCLLGEIEIKFDYYFLTVLFLISTILILRRKIIININSQILFVFFLFCLALSYLPYLFGVTILSNSSTSSWDASLKTHTLEIVLPSYDSLLMSLRILMFLVIAIVISNEFRSKWILLLKKGIYIGAIIYLGLWILEFYFANYYGDDLIRDFYIYSFGAITSTYGSNSLRTVFNLKIPMLTFSEPSYETNLFFVVLLISFTDALREKKPLSIFLAVIYLLLLTTSGALTSILYLFLIFIFIQRNFSKKSGAPFSLSFLPLLLITFILALINFPDRISNILNSIGNFGNGIQYLTWSSEVTRLYSAYNNLTIFLRFPLFGAGLGVFASHSAIVTAFASLGLIGMGIWSNFGISLTRNVYSMKTRITAILLVFIYFMTNHVGQLLGSTQFILIFLVFSYCWGNKYSALISFVPFISKEL